MRTLLSSLGVLSSLLVATPLHAQTGVLDQVSPYPGSSQTALFNGDTSVFTWQAQVRAGMGGVLEGVTITTGSGSAGQSINVRLRSGAGWNTSAVLFGGLATKSSAAQEDIFVNMSSANLTLAPGSLFVIELQGTNTGLGLLGTYTPPPGAPQYSEPLFFNGPGCYSDCGWRIAFQTWVLAGFQSLCFGDGTQSMPCPCANSGAAGHGCENSAATGGAVLVATGSTNPDTVTFQSSGELSHALTIFLQGNQYSSTPLVFGDGLRCVTGSLKRLYVKSASGGVATAPEAGDSTVSAQSAVLGDPIGSGQTRWYQAYYRDASASFCAPPAGNTWNISSAVAVQW